jgi:hypothetical protein
MQGNFAVDNTANGGGQRTQHKAIRRRLTWKEEDKRGRQTTRLVDGCSQQRQIMEHVIGGGDNRGVQGQCVFLLRWLGVASGSGGGLEAELEQKLQQQEE